MEFISGLIVGMGWWLIIPLFLLTIEFDRTYKHGWAIFFTLLTIVCSAILLQAPWAVLGYIAIGYIPVGFLWSFWRWRKHCIEVANDIKDIDNPSNWQIQECTTRVTIKYNITKISGWIIAWPASVIASSFRDVLDAIETSIKKLAKYTYQRWSDGALEEINKANNRAKNK